MDPVEFPSSYNNFMEIVHLIMGKKDKPKKVKEKKKTAKEDKLDIVQSYFCKKFTNFVYIANEVNMTRQEVCSLYKKFQTKGTIFGDFRPKPKKLNQFHLEFIEQYLKKPENFGNSMFDLHDALIKKFELSNKYISVWSLYNYMKAMDFSHKKIIYKVQNANTPKVKDKRFEVALEILTALRKGFEFLYIDEISFNIELRPVNGWGLIGQSIQSSKPPKSKNYSAICCMDIKGVVALRVIKGGVKSQDFFSFVGQLVAREYPPLSNKKIVLMMDNAKVHHSKEYMKKFQNYCNIIYNAPYTPQLNAIEFMFSRLKADVKKLKSKNETELIKNIINVCKSFNSKECAEYIAHSLKFLKNAYDKQDFY